MTEYYIQLKRKMTTKKSRCTSYYTMTKIFAIIALIATTGLVVFSTKFDIFLCFIDVMIESGGIYC